MKQNEPQNTNGLKNKNYNILLDKKFLQNLLEPKHLLASWLSKVKHENVDFYIKGFTENLTQPNNLICYTVIRCVKIQLHPHEIKMC